MKDLLEALGASDPAALTRTVEEAERRFKTGAMDEGEVRALGDALVVHARHPSSRVRKAVAWTARYLPDGAFEEVIGTLRDDTNQFVKRAALDSYDDRSKRRKVVAARDEQSADVRALRARIAKTWGDAAARRADQLADRVLEELVEGLHHELVKVGTSLRLDVDGLRRDARSTTGERLGAPADAVLAKLDVLLGIVKSTRAHVRQTAPSFREVSLRAVVNEHVELLRARLDDARRARLRVEIDVVPTLVADIDRAQLGQALANLLQNAVEAYPEAGEGSIDLRVSAEERLSGTCALVVADRGCGIDAQDLGQMGTPFVSRKGTGRGLGMRNVRRMVERVHGGRVHIESRVGEGTRITVEIPRRQ